MTTPSTEARAFSYHICQGEAMGACCLQTVVKARSLSCIATYAPRVFAEVCKQHVPLPVQG